MSEFRYSPGACVPFRDLEAIERVRRIRREDITRHPNPEFKITVMSAQEVEFRWCVDMFHRIHQAAEAGRKIVIITPNPCPVYAQVAYLLNKFRIDCKHVYTFNMDEYANEKGEIAPETWRFGFMYALKKYFYSQLDPDLRPPECQIQGFTNANITVYGKMIADMGGADICYSGPGWTGHLAFIEPDAPEFAGTLEEWKKMGPRVCTLSPFTLAQNSLQAASARAATWRPYRPRRPPSVRRRSSRPRRGSICTRSACTERAHPGSDWSAGWCCTGRSLRACPSRFCRRCPPRCGCRRASLRTSNPTGRKATDDSP